jgi:putative FmdB family regulatory protein
MTVYEYRCREHGPFEVRADMGTASPTAACPDCGMDGRRAFTAPMTRTAPAAGAARDRAERTRETPDVVASPPPRRRPARPAAPADPALRRLPRP